LARHCAGNASQGLCQGSASHLLLMEHLLHELTDGSNDVLALQPWLPSRGGAGLRLALYLIDMLF